MKQYEQNPAKRPRTSARLSRLAALGIILAAIAAGFSSHYELVIVSGSSMLPTLSSHDVLVIDKRAYAQSEPNRGDIVVARGSASLVVKRVVGLPGEVVEVKTGKLYVNGSPMAELHRIYPGYLEVEKGKLLPGDFATLGDNRSVARASAVHPIVTKEDILGKVVLALGKEIM